MEYDTVAISTSSLVVTASIGDPSLVSSMSKHQVSTDRTDILISVWSAPTITSSAARREQISMSSRSLSKQLLQDSTSEIDMHKTAPATSTGTNLSTATTVARVLTSVARRSWVISTTTQSLTYPSESARSSSIQIPIPNFRQTTIKELYRTSSRSERDSQLPVMPSHEPTHASNVGKTLVMSSIGDSTERETIHIRNGTVSKIQSTYLIVSLPASGDGFSTGYSSPVSYRSKQATTTSQSMSTSSYFRLVGSMFTPTGMAASSQVTLKPYSRSKIEQPLQSFGASLPHEKSRRSSPSAKETNWLTPTKVPTASYSKEPTPRMITALSLVSGSEYKPPTSGLGTSVAPSRASFERFPVSTSESIAPSLTSQDDQRAAQELQLPSSSLIPSTPYTSVSPDIDAPVRATIAPGHGHPTSSVLPTSSPESGRGGSKGTNTSVIAGGVVGGILCLLCLLLLFVYVVSTYKGQRKRIVDITPNGSISTVTLYSILSHVVSLCRYRN